MLHLVRLKITITIKILVYIKPKEYCTSIVQGISNKISFIVES